MELSNYFVILCKTNTCHDAHHICGNGNGGYTCQNDNCFCFRIGVDAPGNLPDFSHFAPRREIPNGHMDFGSPYRLSPYMEQVISSLHGTPTMGSPLMADARGTRHFNTNCIQIIRLCFNLCLRTRSNIEITERH